MIINDLRLEFQFLDFQSAFNMMWQTALLRNPGETGLIFSFVKNFLIHNYRLTLEVHYGEIYNRKV